MEASRARSQRPTYMMLVYLFLVLCAGLLTAAPKAKADNEVTGPVIGIDLGTTYSCVAVSVDPQWHIFD